MAAARQNEMNDRATVEAMTTRCRDSGAESTEVDMGGLLSVRSFSRTAALQFACEVS
jgi:hypothetical protein